ncbi:MAG: hypothetical protein KDA22_15500, partial [Phycisphaerales bacterium]|nr:hypothetical protein [Phycisphaerales bacterium]
PAPLRDLAITLLAEGETIDAVFDPSRVRISSDPAGNALVVMGPPEAVAFLDRVIAVVDQAVPDDSSLKLLPLRYADAGEVRNAVRDIFRSRAAAMPGGRAPEFGVDSRTNTLIVTAAPEQMQEVESLLVQLDRKTDQEIHPLRIVNLKVADAKAVADILDRVVVGTDQLRRVATMVLPDPAAGVLLIRASDEVNAEIDRVVAELDRAGTRDFPVRTLELKHADAGAVATAVQRFYDDRAQIAGGGRGRRGQTRSVSVIGDPASATLLVAASDDDFEQVKAIVERFDSAEAADALDFRVLPLRHARATEIESAVQALVEQLVWGQPFFWSGQGNRQQGRRDEIAVRAEPRLNALVVTGTGDKFDLVERLVTALDAPGAGGDRVVRLYRPRNASPQTVATLLRDTLGQGSRERRWWEPPDRSQANVQVDERTRTIIVAASEAQQMEVKAVLEAVDVPLSTVPQHTEVVQVEYARSAEIAQSLQRFLAERAAIEGVAQPQVAVVPSDSTNTLLLSGAEDDLATVRDILAKLDQPSSAGDRVIEILPLRDGQAQEIARLVGQQFPRSQGGQGVVVTADSRTNSVIVNAPTRQFPEIKALIDRLDAPSDSDVTVIRTYTLAGARAEDAARLLAATLQLDASGRTDGIMIQPEGGPPVEVRAKIVPDRRSNTLVVTATPESIPVIESLIQRLDDVPASSPVEYRIIKLDHAIAADVSYTLRQLVRGEPGEPQPRIDYNRLENQLIVGATADQFEQIDRILTELDQPAESTRITDFVPLRFADAEQLQEALSYFYGPLAMDADTPGKQSVRIVADPATNSLVISADEAEWEGIRALLSKLDSEEYDASLQLRVMPLVHADARSVAQAINDAFQGRIARERQLDQAQRPRDQQQSQQGDRREMAPPAVLVQAEEWVSAAAEELTNSVIVYASRPNFERIELIVKQLDQPGFGTLPPPRVIAVSNGDPVKIADALTKMFAPDASDRGGRSARYGLRIVGDQASNAIVVRASAEEFEQISVLADALQQQSETQGLSVKVLPLKAAPAVRVASAIREAFAAKAKQINAPLSISVDAASNALVVASSGPMFDEIARTVSQMDALLPGAGQAIFVIDLENVSPDAAKSVIETIGLDKPQPENSVSRIVSDPIKVSLLPGRNALVVVANPGDRETVVGLLKALDAEPTMPGSQVRLVKLRNAQAAAMAQLLTQILKPGEQQTQTALAQAIKEQVRRLSFRRNGAQEPDLDLDLTVPVKIVPDPVSNAVLVSSTPANVAVLEQVIAMLDTVPVTDAVTVQIFPLENIAAEQFARIVRELFAQGKRLGAVPGTDLEAVPGGAAGRALLDEVAISVDDRTNTVVVAGKEDAVALVEVLVRRIDTDVASGWVEPRIIPLRFADADRLAATLQAILVDGAADLPESSPLRKQVARLRMLRAGGDEPLQADAFSPMTRTVIRSDAQLNALVVVATPANLAVVGELVKQLDVEAASPSALVRIYPLEHASASKLAAIVTRLFDEQFQSKAIRAEDRVRVQADERSNALIVSTSPRSFAVFESLLARLDAEIPVEFREIRTIPVANASAPRLAGLIQELMDARLDRLRKVQPETADMEKAVVVADPRSNSLVVAAGNESFEVVKRLAEELDSADAADGSLVEVVILEKANADRIAAAVNSILERRYADLPPDVRKSQRPLVLTDSRSNSLLVAAAPEDIRMIRDLVGKLESAPVNPAVGLHVIALASARAETLAPRLEALMRDRRQSLGPAASPSDAVSIQFDAGSNSLIIAASDENMVMIRSLVDVLGQAEQEALVGRRLEILSLAKSRAADVVTVVDNMYVEEENRRRGPGSVRVTADTRLNAVLVTGTDGDIEAVRRIVGRLDGTRPDNVVEIKYIPLASANAVETVALIENILSGRSVAGRRQPQQATVLKYLRALGEGEEVEVDGAETEVSAAIRESINLTPDIRTNTIIVSAPRDSMEMIDRMIRDLDASTTGSQNIRVFKLKNADAEAMARILFDLFSMKEKDNLLVLKPRETGGGEFGPGAGGGVDGGGGASGVGGAGPGLGGLGGIELTAVPDERQQLSITVDSRTNSLLVSASPKYLDLVSQVVLELDAEDANERETKLFRLKNAVAEDVARVVSSFVSEDQRKLISTLGSEQLPSAARMLEREVTIVGDAQTNTVLITASPRYMTEVEKMVNDLDVDPPQVLIQVMLAEVTLDAQDALGVDFSGTVNIGDTAVSAGYGLASAFLGSIGLPPSSSGIPNVSIVGNDFSLVLNALRAQGRVQLLSNPSVMAQNNQPAEIQVGQTIRVPDAVSITSGQQQSAVTPEDIGIILKVTPNINPDGFVRMSINPEISELSSNTTQISENFESPIIDRRRADTTVTVRDGETVVIGGLIQDRYERIVNKVPFFGDIPLMGWLFRSEKESTKKTELLIVLTPYVIVSPSQISAEERQAYTRSEIDRLSMPKILKDQLERSRLQGTGLDFGADAPKKAPPGFMDLERYSERTGTDPRDSDPEVKTVPPAVPPGTGGGSGP